MKIITVEIIDETPLNKVVTHMEFENPEAAKEFIDQMMDSTVD
jgi:hypothetical protein